MPRYEVYTASLSSASNQAAASDNVRNNLGAVPDQIVITPILGIAGGLATGSITDLPVCWLVADPTSGTGGVTIACQRTGTSARISLERYHSIMDATTNAW